VHHHSEGVTQLLRNGVTAADVLEEAIFWLLDSYQSFIFFQERDLVWTLQTRLTSALKQHRLRYRVFSEQPMLPGQRRSISTDLAIVDFHDRVQVAAEFKYEPSHTRSDILPQKFPVVQWSDVSKDVRRVRDYLKNGIAATAYAIFIDEAGHFQNHEPPKGSRWIAWHKGVRVLWTEVQAS
jgi:hypothetical protein